jgi:hypothetical protein
MPAATLDVSSLGRRVNMDAAKKIAVPGYAGDLQLW